MLLEVKTNRHPNAINDSLACMAFYEAFCTTNDRHLNGIPHMVLDVIIIQLLHGLLQELLVRPSINAPARRSDKRQVERPFAVLSKASYGQNLAERRS